MLDGAATIDTSVFTKGDLLTDATKTIAVATSDPAKTAVYEFKVEVWYQDYPSVKGEQTFKIEVANPCASANINLNNNVIPSTTNSYTIGTTPAAEIVFAFGNISDDMTGGLCPDYEYDVRN